jgi:hypothetical protein
MQRFQNTQKDRFHRDSGSQKMCEFMSQDKDALGSWTYVEHRMLVILAIALAAQSAKMRLCISELGQTSI